jgi:hypothetical protein
MKETLMHRIAIVVALWLLPLCAQEISGTWQGTLHVGPQDLRILIQFAKSDQDAYTAKLYSIDQDPNPIAATSVVLEGLNLKLAIFGIGFSYEGKLTPDSASIEGTATRGATLPLELRRATKKTPGRSTLVLIPRSSPWWTRT